MFGLALIRVTSRGNVLSFMFYRFGLNGSGIEDLSIEGFLFMVICLHLTSRAGGTIIFLRCFVAIRMAEDLSAWYSIPPGSGKSVGFLRMYVGQSVLFVFGAGVLRKVQPQWIPSIVR